MTADLAEGVVLGGRFRLERRLGEGGMGVVWAAREIATGRARALKLLLERQASSEDARRRLVREARAASALRHPAVVTVHEVVELEDGAPLLVMDLLRGEPLSEKLRREKVLSIHEAAGLLVPVVSAVGAAHAAGIVHRDLKPENVFLAEGDGGARAPTVLDFGIAKLTAAADPALQTQALTSTGALLGTPCYMAPEQATGEADVDHRADVWALGLILYQCLSGILPTAGDNLGKVFAAILAEPIRPLSQAAPGAPPDVAALVDRMLARPREGRPADLREVLATLERHTEVRAPSFGASTVPTPAPRPPREPPDPSSPPAASASPFAVTADRGVMLDPALAPTMVAPPGAASPEGGAAASRPSPAPASPSRGDEPAGGARRRGTRVLAGLAMLAIAVSGAALSRGARSPAPAAAPGAEASARGSPGAPRIDAVGCEPATVTGGDGVADLAGAIGIGACARLAVDLGASWETGGSAPRIAVTAALRKEGTTVTLSLAGRSATATAPSPNKAIDAAVAKLAGELDGPPPTPEVVKDWGAKDGASARRIRRLWRRIVLSFDAEEDYLAEARRLVAADEGSPWPHAVLANASPTERAEAVARAVALPPARARALRAALLTGASRDSADGLLRALWREAPEDPEIAELAMGPWSWSRCPDVRDREVLAIGDAIFARMPAHARPYLECAIMYRGLDDARWQVAVDRFRAMFPWRMAGVSYGVLVRGREAEARRAIALGQVLEGNDPEGLGYAALALLEPKRALEEDEKALGQAGAQTAVETEQAIVADLLMAGRVADAESHMAREYVQEVSSMDAFVLPLLELKTRRRLGHAVPAGAQRFEALSAALLRGDLDEDIALWLRVELPFLRAKGRLTRADAARALAETEAFVDTLAKGDPRRRQELLVMTFPLVRAARGPAAAGRLFREAATNDRYHREWALDAGIALEAAGDREGAEQAYTIAQDIYGTSRRSFDMIAARVRLADLLRATGRPDRAAALDAVVDRVWAEADPGLREAVRRLR